MRQKSNMVVSLVFSVFLLTKLNTCYDVRSVDVIQDLSLSDFIFTDDVLFDTSVRSPLECAQVCSALEECASFTYHRDSLTSCRGHTSVMTSNSSSTPAAGTKAYVISRVLSGNLCFLLLLFTLFVVAAYCAYDGCLQHHDPLWGCGKCAARGLCEMKLVLGIIIIFLPDLLCL